MSDCITREAAREAVWQILNGMGYSEKHNDRLVEEVDAVFDDIPAADVRSVVKAKIVDMRYTEDDGEWKCSHCGRQFTLCVCGKDVTRKIHYCPNCGADMRPPKEGE